MRAPRKARSTASADATRESQYERIFAVVDSIPKGRVSTYGEVAREAGLTGHARQVGYALRNLPPKTDLPWHRVINAQGKVSLQAESGRRQMRRLKKEGVRFDAAGRVKLADYLWRPD